jgi:hypothetical protein
MRLGFTPKDGDTRLPEAHAGDEVAVIAQGRLPQIYRRFLPEQNKTKP